MLRKMLVMLLIIIASLFFGACEVSTADISEVKICTELDGDTCPADEATLSTDVGVVHLSGKLNNAVEGTEVIITWRYLDDPQDIDSVTLTTEESGSGPFSSSLNGPEAGWPVGNYEVVVALGADDEAPIHKEFEIK